MKRILKAEGHLSALRSHAKAGDVLVCINPCADQDFTVGTAYTVLNSAYGNVTHVLDDRGLGKYYSSATFALYAEDTDAAPDGQKDKWDELATGGHVKENKSNEWQPDVLDVDLSKKIWEW